jgi:hypothetical protein
LWAQFETIMVSAGALTMFSSYLVALVGILLRKKWGTVITGLLAILDLPLVLFLISGPDRIGALVVDTIIYLTYDNYKLLSVQVPPVEIPEDNH